MSKVDVIIPVCSMNADLKRCVTSIRENSFSESYNIVIIYSNDLKEFIDYQRKYFQDSNIQFLLYNGNNYFYELANEAIRRTKNDIILLDANLIVTKNWLYKLHNCALQDSSIATVTPLCNYGYICSVPNFNEKNIFPSDSKTINEIADVVETVSRKQYPEIPTAVGFCMYIKRVVINEVGLFDADTNGKGFGEDKDFSWRANQFGYRHVMCDDTFLYCSSSGMPEAYKKYGYIDNNYKDLYKAYNERLNKFLIENPLEMIQKKIKLHLLIHNGRKNILFQLHYGFEAENECYMGGTQTLVKNIIKDVQYFYNCFLLFKDFQGFTLNVYISGELVVLKYHFNGPLQKLTYTNPKIAHLMYSILTEYSISIVHIHHTLYQTFDMIYEANKLHIPIVLSLHDYYWICPSVNLLSHEDKFCIDIQNPEYCKTCLKRKLSITENVLTKWRAKVNEVFKMCQLIITPSKSTKNIYMKFYPEITKKIIVIPHGIDKVTVSISKKLDIAEQVNVAFVGCLTPIKGSNLEYKIVTEKNNYGFRWFFFGQVADKRFLEIKDENVYIYGQYNQKELVDLLYSNGINLVCLLSVCPETFSLVLSEIMEAGIPIIATDIGALSERISEADCGWLIPVDASAIQVLEIIEKIHKNPNEYQKKVNNLKKYKVRDVNDMAADYLKIYDSLIKKFGEGGN